MKTSFRMFFIGCLSLIFLLFESESEAQNTSFGQNLVIFSRCEWQVLRGPQVDINFCPEWIEVARYALLYAEESVDTLQIKFNLPNLEDRPQIWVYSSHIGFEQSHLAGFIPEGVGGFTEFAELRIGFPFEMNFMQFRHVIRHELVHWFHFIKIRDVYENWRCPLPNGSSAEDSLRFNSRLSDRDCIRFPFFMPLGWVEGLAEYWSAGEDSRDHAFNRDLTISGRIPVFRNWLYDYSYAAYPLGGEIIRFLGTQYGDERVLRLYEEMPAYGDFTLAMDGVYGENPEMIFNRLRDALRRLYLPGYSVAQTLTTHESRVPTRTRLAISPLYYEIENDSATECHRGNIIFITPENGYTTLYELEVNRTDNCSQAFGATTRLLQTEDRANLESIHFGQSRMSVWKNRLLFVSKHLDRDVIHIFDLPTKESVRILRFDSLITIRSPVWSPNGDRIAFIGAPASGMSDIYVFDTRVGTLLQITNDHYMESDLTWSPHGNVIVFSSDRTRYGRTGARNLFFMNLDTRVTRPLTNGNFQDGSPRFSPNGSLILFDSDRRMPQDSFGTSNIFIIDTLGNGHRITNVLGTATDPVWVNDSVFVFVGFENMNYSLYLEKIERGGANQDSISLDTNFVGSDWVWFEREDSLMLREIRREAYRNRFHLNLSSIQASVVGSGKGFGFNIGGAILGNNPPNNQFLYTWFSFRYSKHRGHESRWNTSTGGFLFANLANRRPWILGVRNHDEILFDPSWWLPRHVIRETGYEGFGILSHPFSRFERLDLGLTLGQTRSSIIYDDSGRTYGDESVFDLPDPKSFEYRCVCLGISGSFVRDNALFIENGPISGERYRLDASLRANIGSLNLHNYTVRVDWRKYLRRGLYSAWALQVFGHWSNGSIPDRIGLGGTSDFPLYPLQGFYTDKSWKIAIERRSQLTQRLIIGINEENYLALPGFQIAPFCSAGQFGLGKRMGNIWGSCGASLRMPLIMGGLLRLDVGHRFYIGRRPDFEFNGFAAQLWFGPNF